jgi:hypothetical protein
MRHPMNVVCPICRSEKFPRLHSGLAIAEQRQASPSVGIMLAKNGPVLSALGVILPSASIWAPNAGAKPTRFCT